MEKRIKKIESKFRKLDVDTTKMPEFDFLKRNFNLDDISITLKQIESKYYYLRSVIDKFYKLINIYECFDVAIINSNMFNGIERNINTLKEQIIDKDFNADKSIISRIIEEELLALEERISLLNYYTEEIAEIGKKYEAINIDPVLIPEFENVITNFINLKSYIRNVNVQTKDDYIQTTIELLKSDIKHLKEVLKVCNFSFTNTWKLAEKLEKSGIDIYGIEEFQNLVLFINSINKSLAGTIEEEEIQIEEDNKRNLHM